MDKVAGFHNINAPVASTLTPFSTSMERNPMIRGHHSSVGKAVEAHRQMVGERQSRNLVRREGMQAASEFSNTDLVVAQQVSDSSGTSDDSEYPAYENTLIELPSTQAKMASIQSFQSSEPDRPVLGEPVPKGSYLDIEA
jgi:hypothetical protein